MSVQSTLSALKKLQSDVHQLEKPVFLEQLDALKLALINDEVAVQLLSYNLEELESFETALDVYQSLLFQAGQEARKNPPNPDEVPEEVSGYYTQLDAAETEFKGYYQELKEALQQLKSRFNA